MRSSGSNWGTNWGRNSGTKFCQLNCHPGLGSNFCGCCCILSRFLVQPFPVFRIRPARPAALLQIICPLIPERYKSDSGGAAAARSGHPGGGAAGAGKNISIE